MRLGRAFSALVVCAGTGATFAACYAATAVHVQLGTDVPCGDATRAGPVTALYVAELGAVAGAASLETDRCSAPVSPENIGTIALRPSGARDARMLIEAVLSVDGRAKTTDACRADPAGCVIARRIVSYRKQQTLPLPIFFSNQCIGVDCRPSETCVDGVCRSADVDNPGFCATGGCDAGAPAVDAGAEATPPPPPDTPPCAKGEAVLVPNIGAPVGPMRVNATHVYWASQGGIAALSKQPVGAAPTFVPAPKAFALNDRSLIVATNSGVDLFSLDGARRVDSHAYLARGVAGFGSDVYATDGNSVSLLGAVGGDAETFLFTQPVSRFAVNGAHFFIADATGLTIRTTAPGFGIEVTSASLKTVRDVVATSDGAAFLRGDGVDFTDGKGFTSLQVPGALNGVALDARYVYYSGDVGAVAGGSGVFYRSRSQPPDEKTLASNLASVQSVATDGSCVYFWRRPANSASQGGEIVAVPAPL